MEKFFRNVQEQSGKAVQGAQIDVYDADTANHASLFQDDEVTPISQPLATNADGEFSFKAANGVYDIKITKGGSSETHKGFVLNDFNDALPALTLTTPLGVASGGTGSSTASGARTALGVAIGTDVQAYDAQLDDLAGIAPAKGTVIVFNGTNWVGLGVGTDGQHLEADSAQANGVKWATPASSSNASETVAGVVEEATPAEVKAETATGGTGAPLFVNPADLKNNDGVSKVWVNFKGTGTVAINDSHNVSSMTDNGVGDYTANYSITTANSDYCVTTSGHHATTGTYSRAVTVGEYSAATTTTTSIRVTGSAHGGSSNALIDIDKVHIAIHGDI